MRWSTKPIAAVCAVLFATLTAMAWGDTTGPFTTGSGGDDPAGVVDVVTQVHVTLPHRPSGSPRVTIQAPAPGTPPHSVPEAPLAEP